MDIIVVTNSTPNKSKPYAGKHVVRHIEMHREAGHTVRIISPQESRQGIFWTTWKYLQVTLHVIWATLFYPVDVVHAHWVLPSGLFGAIIAMLRRKPFVVTSHGAFTDVLDKHNAFTRALVHWVLSRAACIIAVGVEQQKTIEQMLGLPAGTVRLINMGVLIPEHIPGQSEARQRLNLAEDRQIVIFIGNMLRRKGPDLLVRAVAELHDPGSLQVYIGGQGAYEPQVAQLIEELGLAERVKMIGTVQPENVFTWFAAADICVVPSRTEPFGLVAAEALACGTPVVASAVGGLKESVEDGSNGLLFPNEDYHALAQCVERLLNDSDLYARLSAAAPESIGRYNMRFQAAKVLEIYTEVIAAQSNKRSRRA